MSSATKSGRERDVGEIVMYERAAEVGRLFLGELKAPMKWIYYDQYLDKPRKVLQARRHSIRAYLRGEIEKFCCRNFENVRPKDLARLYEPLFARGSVWRLPFTDFVKELGVPREGVLRGAPLHSTVSLSYLWGLQTEYPEMHLFRDLAISFNAIVTAEAEIHGFESIPRSEAKTKQAELAKLESHISFNKRMCLLSCFNLIEAYINGLAWEYVQTHDISAFGAKKKNLLTEEERPVNLIDKLVKIPRIITGRDEGPLHETREPLKSFIGTVKPYRDSIVHASPFSASERFGGYDKLSRLYERTGESVKIAVDNTLAVIGEIHRYVVGKNNLPGWVYPRNSDGTFEIESPTTRHHVE